MKLASKHGFHHRWQRLAEHVLLLAGSPRPDNADDVLTAHQGQNAGLVVWAVDPSNGSVLDKRTLDTLQVRDGTAAAYDDLYVTREDTFCVLARSS